eukprot:SAG11_NODE_24654_length_370_cov_0.693727_1_plen_41_part_10
MPLVSAHVRLKTDEAAAIMAAMALSRGEIADAKRKADCRAT